MLANVAHGSPSAVTEQWAQVWLGSQSHYVLVIPFNIGFCSTAEKNVLLYLNDAVTQLLEHKEEYTQFGVVRYFAE